MTNDELQILIDDAVEQALSKQKAKLTQYFGHELSEIERELTMTPPRVDFSVRRVRRLINKLDGL